MNAPFLARYGARQNAHECLFWDGPGQPPSQLLGLTDRPPGTVAPHEIWWPAVGCGPLASWWALWWTVPDTGSVRPGMVASTVAVWPMANIGQVDDLVPVLEQLGRGHPLTPPPHGLLVQIVNTILDPSRRGPAVMMGLDVWPGALATLWRHVWPEARAHFTARVSLTPSSDRAAETPLIVAIPTSASQAERFGQRIDRASVTPTGPGERWFLGEYEAIPREIIVAFPLMPDLGSLRSRARAAERFAAYRRSPSFSTALDLLRTLLSLNPDPLHGAAIKQEAAATIQETLPMGATADIRALANIPIAQLPPATAGALANAVCRWAAARLPHEPRAAEMLTQDAESWWTNALRDAFTSAWAGANRPADAWIAATLSWLAEPTLATWLGQCLPQSGASERWLSMQSMACDMPTDRWSRIGAFAADRRWSQLHGAACMRHLPLAEALHRQTLFAGDPLPGLAWIAKESSGEALVAAFVDAPCQAMIRFVADRTVSDIGLLAKVDVTSAGWRMLWQAHLEAGGSPWPPAVDRSAICRLLIELYADGSIGSELLSYLCADLASAIAEHPRREVILDRIAASDASLLNIVLPLVARHIIENWQRLYRLPGSIPPRLATAVARALSSDSADSISRPTVQIAIDAMGWRFVSDADLATWVVRIPSREWQFDLAAQLGEGIRAHHRGESARILADAVRRGAMHLLPALGSCMDMLNALDRCRMVSMGDLRQQISDSDMIAAVAELGANLAPERLKFIWVRAGGREKDLPYATNPADHWHHASAVAHQGGLTFGLCSLLWGLSQLFPMNGEVGELRTLIESNSNAPG